MWLRPKSWAPIVVVFSHSVLLDSLQPQGLQLTRLPVRHHLPELAQTHVHWVSVHRVHWVISSSLVPFSSCTQPFPASGSFLISWLFSSCGQSTRTSASVSVLPMNIQSWFPLGLTNLIFLLSEGLSRVFSGSTVQKHRFFSAQLSLWFNSHICTWLLGKP